MCKCNILQNSLILTLTFFTYIDEIKSDETQCSFKDHSDEEDGNPCSSEDHSYTPFYIWMGVVIATTICLIAVFACCIWCSCCLIYKRRRAVSEAIARRTEISAVSTHLNEIQISPYPTHPAQSQAQTTTYPNVQIVPNQFAYRPFTQQYAPNQAHLYEEARTNPMYAPSAPPVFPDEPPPRYAP